jgi:hypothetical protein
LIKEITMTRTVLFTAAAGLLITLAGCDKASSEKAVETTATTEKAQPIEWILTSEPQGAISITEAKANGKEGDTVILRGRIGGRHSPISADSPVFTVIDLQLEYCGQNEDDGCSTPWDYCCETPGTIASNSATVQIVGEGSVNPVAAGLEALDEVILIGTVGPRPTEEVFTIRATGVYLADG